MDIALTILVIVCGAGFLFLYYAPAVWAIGDAQRRGKSSALIVVLFFLLGPLSIVVWLAMRPSENLVDQVPNVHDNADDALASAASLDQLGEWDAAIAVYQDVLKRWPEHQQYVANCLAQIKAKQSMM